MLSEDSASRGLQLLVARADFQRTLGPSLHRLHGYGAGNGLLPFPMRRHGKISHTLLLTLSKTENGSYTSSFMSPSAFIQWWFALYCNSKKDPGLVSALEERLYLISKHDILTIAPSGNAIPTRPD